MMKSKLFLSALLFATLPVTASDGWVLVTNDSQKISMERVVSLLTADNDATFNVLLNDGSVINDIEYCTFAQSDGITHAIASGSKKPFIANGRIVLSNMAEAGCAIGVYGLDGRIIMSTISDGTSCTIYISHQQPGAYVLRIGSKSMKFIKR